jgi:MFS transporter, FSR family, fosmidomycin resistance protein
MTQAVSAPARRSSEFRIVAPVCAAHFLSHYYMIVLAPLFAFVRADYGVSYTDLALALTAFNVVSALLQTPAGFVVDRYGARLVLIAGVAFGAVSFAVAGLVNSFVVFVGAYAVAGLGNTVYHPADYSLLAHHSAPARLGQIFAFHTFAGILGAAVAPATLLAMESRFGWRGAYLGAAILGFAVLAILLAQRPAPDSQFAAKRRAGGRSENLSVSDDPGWRLLFSPPIILNLVFFVLLSLMSGLNTFLVVALGALYGTSDALANVALTGLLTMNAFGVLVGGLLASRTEQHVAIAAFGLAAAGVATALVGLVDFSPFALVLVASLSGFFVGVTPPSRDMLVRAATPPGAIGRVFGFVSTGFNIGAAIAPVVYGYFMDRGEARAVFMFSAVSSILCIGTVVFGISRRGPAKAGAAAAI